MPNRNKEKGSRGEIKLVKEFEKAGFRARRIPYSGALESWKGDVEAWTPKGKLTGEVKIRSSGFKFLYDNLGVHDFLAIREVKKEEAAHLNNWQSTKPYLIILTLDKFLEILDIK